MKLLRERNAELMGSGEASGRSTGERREDAADGSQSSFFSATSRVEPHPFSLGDLEEEQEEVEKEEEKPEKVRLDVGHVVDGIEVDKRYRRSHLHTVQIIVVQMFVSQSNDSSA